MPEALRATHTGHYVSAEQGGGGSVQVNRDTVDIWETLRAVPGVDGMAAIVTHDGQHLLTDQGDHVDASGTCLDAATARWVVSHDGDRIAFRTLDGRFMSARDGGGRDIELKRVPGDEPHAYEWWRRYDLDRERPPVNGTPGPGNGLDHDERRLSLAFLYPEIDFLAACRIGGESDAWLHEHLARPEVTEANAVKVTANQGHRPAINAVPFDGWRNLDTLRRKLQIIIDAGKAPIVMLTAQTYWEQELHKDIGALNRCLEETTRGIADLCLLAAGMWEVGEVFTRRHLEQRHLMNQLIRRGAVAAGHPELRIGVHERVLEGGPGLRPRARWPMRVSPPSRVPHAPLPARRRPRRASVRGGGRVHAGQRAPHPRTTADGGLHRHRRRALHPGTWVGCDTDARRRPGARPGARRGGPGGE